MKILIADDTSTWRIPLSEFCKKEGHEVTAVTSGSAVVQLPASTILAFDVALLDYKMPGKTGLEAGEFLRTVSRDITLVMLTAHADAFTVDHTRAAMRSGFYEYLDKNSDYKTTLKSILKLAEGRQKTTPPVAKCYTIADIVGESANMDLLRKLITKVAPTDANVLILGESGTGKELIAGAVHSLSRRRDKACIRINCAALTETLLESELFGHEKGAFTGAIGQRLGWIEVADGGTIFLDEIGDMAVALQAKVLRFLEERTFARVGGRTELRADVRLVAASNRDLQKAIRDEKFREDLFYRLNVFSLLPLPLRERREDILPLARHFLTKLGDIYSTWRKELSSAAEEKLMGHSWPGNVRELRNAIQRAVILEESPVIQPASLPNFEFGVQPRRPETLAIDPLTFPSARTARSSVFAREDTLTPHQKKMIGDRLNNLEEAFPAALKHFQEDPDKGGKTKKVRLSDLGWALGVSGNTAGALFRFTCEWGGISGERRHMLIRELTVEFPNKWPALRGRNSPFAQNLRTQAP
jgi:DNA-binding NtrC family response regulator